MKKGTDIVYLKQQKKYMSRTRTTFYSIFNMNSCRKPKYKMICLKSPKTSEFAKSF